MSPLFIARLTVQCFAKEILYPYTDLPLVEHAAIQFSLAIGELRTVFDGDHTTMTHQGEQAILIIVLIIEIDVLSQKYS